MSSGPAKVWTWDRVAWVFGTPLGRYCGTMLWAVCVYPSREGPHLVTLVLPACEVSGSLESTGVPIHSSQGNVDLKARCHLQPPGHPSLLSCLVATAGQQKGQPLQPVCRHSLPLPCPERPGFWGNHLSCGSYQFSGRSRGPDPQGVLGSWQLALGLCTCVRCTCVCALCV